MQIDILVSCLDCAGLEGWCMRRFEGKLLLWRPVGTGSSADKVLIAKYIAPLGWEIGVYQYPYSSHFVDTPATLVVDDSSSIEKKPSLRVVMYLGTWATTIYLEITVVNK